MFGNKNSRNEIPRDSYDPFQPNASDRYTIAQLNWLRRKLLRRAAGFLAVGALSGALFIIHESKTDDARDLVGGVEVGLTSASIAPGVLNLALAGRLKKDIQKRTRK